MINDTTSAFGSPLRIANSAARFLLELGALASLAVWGFGAGDGILLRVLFGTGMPALAGTLWGLFVAPRARFVLPTLLRTGVELLVFGTAALAIWMLGAPAVAATFGALAVLNTAMTNHWHQWEEARATMA